MDKSSRIATLSAGMEGINHITRALYSYKQAALYKELATSANLHPVYVSQCLSSAKDVGLCESAGERGRYKLTPKGEEYGRLISYGDTEGAKSLLKNILLNHPTWIEIIRFLRVSYNQERNALSLVAHVEGKLGKHWSQSIRLLYAKNYSSVLNYAGLITLSGENIISQISPSDQEISDAKQSSSSFEIRKPAQNASIIDATSVSNENYAEFSIPDSFKVFIRRDANALAFFESQIKENSIFIPWINNEKRKIQTNTIPEKSDKEQIQTVVIDEQ
jgi:hypothetical protein